MAWANVKAHASFQWKDTVAGTNALSTLAPTSTIPVGNVAVVWLATDSEYDSADPNGGPMFGTNACHDDAGNIWVSICCGQSAGVKVGPSVTIFACYVQNALTTSHVVTATSMRFPSGTEIARAMWLHEFALDPGYVWANVGPVHELTNAADPAAISLSSLASGYEYLFLHVLGGEGPETDAYTWDSDYTTIAGNGTTGGAADTNIHVRGGWRISNSITSDTVDVTSDTADRDYAQAFTALAAVPYDDLFPTTPILDDFNRANEDPLTQSGGWVSSGCSAVSGPAEYAQVVSSTVASGRGGQYRTDTYSGGDAEVYATMATAGWLGVIMAGTNCADAGNADGLAALWHPIDSNLDPIRQSIECGSQGNTGQVDALRLLGWSDRVNGNKLGIQRRTDATHYWADIGSGWQWFGSILNYGIYATSGYENGGKLGFALGDTTVRMDDFGGGASIPVFVPQIIRTK